MPSRIEKNLNIFYSGEFRHVGQERFGEFLPCQVLTFGVSHVRFI